MKISRIIENSNKLVIKIGSSLLIDKGKFHRRWFESFVEDIVELTESKKIIIVASGAVSLGKDYLELKNKENKINLKQAFAACGQTILMNSFIEVFKKKKKK